MKTMSAIASFAMLVSLNSLALSQDNASKQLLVQSIAKLAAEESYFTGGIVEEDPKEEDGALGGIQRVVVTSIGGGNTGASFSGEFELAVSKDSAVSLVSKEEFPGVKLWSMGEKMVCIQAHEKSPFKVDTLCQTVKQLVDWKSLTEAVEKSSKVRVSTKNDETVIRVVLDNEFIPVDSIEKQIGKKLGGAGIGMAVQVQGAPSFSPKIVDLVAEFTLSGKGELKSVEYVIQYNDPVKSMMAGAVRAGGAGGIRIQGNVQKAGDAQDELGKLVTYSFEKAPAPLDRASTFAKQARELSKSK